MQKLVPRLCFLMFFLLSGWATSYAQTKDKIDSLVSQKKDKLESKKEDLESKKDDLQSKFDSLKDDNKLTRAKEKMDSIRDNNAIVDTKQRMDSIQTQLNDRINKLTALQLPDSIAGKEISALRNQLDSIKGLVPVGNIAAAQQRLLGVQSAVNQKISGAQNRINGKLSVFNSNGGNLPGNVNIPQVNAAGNLGGNLNIPGVGGQMPSMPNASIPGLNASKLDLNTNLPGVNTKLPEVGGANLGDVTKKVGSYSEDLKNLKTGNLDQAKNLSGDAEKKLAEAGGMDAYKDQLGQAQSMQNWKNDPDYMKELAFKQAKEQVTDHFAGHEKELMAAMDKLSSQKEKYAKVGGVVDMFKKPENPMKSKKFIDRLQPGLSLQFQSSTNQWFDWWPTMGYHWSHRLITGIGWNERVSYNFKKWQYVSADRAYGPRAYSEFMLKADFYVRAEAEYINAPVTSPYILLQQPDPPGRQWVWSYFAGVKKSFSLGGVVKGNVQTLYNLYNPLHRSPYNTRLVIRMGIEFPMRWEKKKKDENTDE